MKKQSLKEAIVSCQNSITKSLQSHFEVHQYANLQVCVIVASPEPLVQIYNFAIISKTPPPTVYPTFCHFWKKWLFLEIFPFSWKIWFTPWFGSCLGWVFRTKLADFTIFRPIYGGYFDIFDKTYPLTGGTFFRFFYFLQWVMKSP